MNTVIETNIYLNEQDIKQALSRVYDVPAEAITIGIQVDPEWPNAEDGEICAKLWKDTQIKGDTK